MEWLQNLSNAIEYIENNLDGDISYDEAARIACCSPFYFQRMFSYVAGIPLSSYVRRRRMTQAAFDLQRTDQKVLDIALKYGYTSPTSFNRAFQKVHGITPAAAKSPGCTLNAFPPIKFSINITGGNSMPYHIVEKPAMRLVGIRTPLLEDMEENLINIPKFWKSTLHGPKFPEICGLRQNHPKGILGVSIYQNPEHIYYYIAAATSEDAPFGMYEHEIPAATWVIFENEGHFKEKVQDVFRRFYTQWLPFSGYEYAGLPDIEVYPVAEDKPVTGHSEVWVAIKKKRSSSHGLSD